MDALSFLTEVQKKRGRGAAKALNTSEPMYIEFNQWAQHTGEFSKEFGKQIGHCATRVKITSGPWKEVSESLKDSLWEETKVCNFLLVLLFELCYLS
jgi:hypothetical protein